MKPKTSLLLYHLLWTTETLMRPTYRNLNSSFEGWAYRAGFLAQIHRLEAAGLIESRGGPLKRDRFVRLTEDGLLAALGGRDPEAYWTEPWDQKWRLVLFDLPEKEHTLRKKIHRALIESGCGNLQGSVWISPRVPPCAARLLEEHGCDCSHLILLEAASQGPTADHAMVRAAWDFTKINALYLAHQKLLDHLPDRTADRNALLQWGREENEAWLKSIQIDPLLPSALLLSNYAGRKAWKKRRKALLRVAALADSCQPLQ